MNWIDRAEAKFGHWAIPHLIRGIGIASALAFVFYKFDPSFLAKIALLPERVMAGEIWRLVSFLFTPSIFSLFGTPDWLNAVFYILFMLWMDRAMEQVWGSFRVNLYCLLTYLGLLVAAFIFGASSTALMFTQAIFFAFARYFPDEQIVLYFIPLKVRWVAWFSAAWLLLKFVTLDNLFRLSLLSSFIGYLVFFGHEIWQEFKTSREVSARRQKFHAQVQKEVGETLHRCEVCGRTELTSPDLEFRVARDGHEYCLEHLPKAPVMTPPTVT